MLRRMEEFQRVMERDPSIGYSFSLADIIRAVNMRVPRARAEVGRHPQQLGRRRRPVLHLLLRLAADRNRQVRRSELHHRARDVLLQGPQGREHPPHHPPLQAVHLPLADEGPRHRSSTEKDGKVVITEVARTCSGRRPGPSWVVSEHETGRGAVQGRRRHHRRSASTTVTDLDELPASRSTSRRATQDAGRLQAAARRQRRRRDGGGAVEGGVQARRRPHRHAGGRQRRAGEERRADELPRLLHHVDDHAVHLPLVRRRRLPAGAAGAVEHHGQRLHGGERHRREHPHAAAGHRRPRLRHRLRPLHRQPHDRGDPRPRRSARTRCARRWRPPARR